MAAAATRRRTKSWTVMVFMTSDTDLEFYADVDIAEMQNVGSGPDVNVLVQVDRRRFKNPARFLVKEGGRTLVSKPRNQANAGVPNVLENFLEFARTRYPAEKYMLVLWGHGFALGFGRDRGNALTVNELAKVLEGFAQRANHKLDLLGFDACSMSTAEIAYQLRDSAQYVVASQLGIPYGGWPYEDILSRITNRPGMLPETLGRHIVSDFADSYEPAEVALTLVRLDAGTTATMKNAVEGLAESLHRAAGQSNERKRIRKAFEVTAKNGHNTVERALIDFHGLCGRLRNGRRNGAIKAAAESVREALRQAVIAHETVPRKIGDDVRGLGVYAAHVAKRSDPHKSKRWKSSYKRLDLMESTLWNELIDKLESRKANG